MSKTLSLQVTKRDITGRKVKRLRRENILPANVFGDVKDSIAVQVDALVFEKIYEQAGDTNIINLTIDQAKTIRPVMVSNIDFDPITDEVIHVDFRQVNLKEKTTAIVPIALIGESKAQKEDGAMILTQLTEVEVEALPQDIPNEITIDISQLVELNDSLSVEDLVYDKSKVELLVEPETIVVMAQEARMQEEPEPEEEQVLESEDGAESLGEEDSDETSASDTSDDSSKEVGSGE